MSEYNAKDDGEQSYLAAIEAKKARGDDYYLLPHKDARLLRSSLESVSRFSRLNPSIQCIDKSLSSPLAGRAVARPGIGHEDFSGSLQGVHIQGASSPDEADSRAKPGALNHGGAA